MLIYLIVVTLLLIQQFQQLKVLSLKNLWGIKKNVADLIIFDLILFTRIYFKNFDWIYILYVLKNLIYFVTNLRQIKFKI